MTSTAPACDDKTAASPKARPMVTIVFALACTAAAVAFVVRPSSRSPILLVLGIVALVTLHEAGHFFAARKTGMKATEFFVGFGPRVWSFRRGETEYGIKAIPAGGYVRIIGMSTSEQLDEADEPRSYRAASHPRRLAVVSAGVVVNFVLAFALIFVGFLGHGQIVDRSSVQIGDVAAGSPAQHAGLRPGDLVIEVDGERPTDWDDLRNTIAASRGHPLAVTVDRNGVTVDTTVTPEPSADRYLIGIAPRFSMRDIGPAESAAVSIGVMRDSATDTVKALGRLVSPDGIRDYSQNFTDNRPAAGTAADEQRVRSIIGIVDVGSQVASGDLWVLVQLLGLISLALAVLNALPLPPFDGGHAAVAAVEWAVTKLRRRAFVIDSRRLVPVAFVVLALFVSLGVSAMWLDTADLISR